ncbi:uncharacterized protein [Lolium perenne]|uniref:uncharacterized protein n=1 Tax=Lolium perenne TaxID=4522 RepID=UPI0021EB1003|nr:uncharacterized protein LOC127336968 [Lolium perenne]
MDQHNEQHQEEDNLLREPTDQHEEESSAEPAGQRSVEPTDQPKAEAAAEEEERSSDEESMAGSSLFVHPCSLLQYLARAFASCLGMQDSFGGMTKRSAAASPASVDSSREGEADRDRSAGATGFYMQEVITRVWAVRRPRPPGNAREGNGGNGGHHH